MGGLAVGLYPSKYGVDMPAGEDPIKANIFANRFSALGGKYPSMNFRAEGWIYGPPSH